MVEMNSNAFAYHVIRYVPNLIRDEWVNIGVVIHDPATEKFRVRLIEEEPEYARVRRLHPAADEAILRQYRSMLDDSLSRHDGTLTEWIAKLDRSLSTGIEFSPRKGLSADDLDVELDRLYASFVALPACARVYRWRRRNSQRNSQRSKSSIPHRGLVAKA